jgi:hypothetical protein
LVTCASVRRFTCSLAGIALSGPGPDQGWDRGAEAREKGGGMLRLRRISTVKHSPRRVMALFFLMALTLAALTGFSCRATSPGARPANAVISPEWGSLNIQSLGFVTVGSSVGEEEARQTTEYVAEEQLTSNQDRFVILGAQTARGRAAAAGAEDAFVRLAKAWHDQRMADKFLVEDLCRKMGVDGLLFGDLLEWRREKVDFTQEGASYTQIALRLVIISGKSGLPVWEAQKMIRRDTPVYTPGAGGSGVTTDDTGVSRAQRLGGLTPEPPRPEVVLVDVLASLIAAFPPRATQ